MHFVNVAIISDYCELFAFVSSYIFVYHCVSISSADHLPFKVIYHTVGFKDTEAKVFLSLPITAKILEVERFTSAQDRFNVTTQRSVNKVHTKELVS